MNAERAMPLPERGRTGGGVYWEVHGRGVPLLLGFPVLASYAQVFGAEGAATVQQEFLKRLTDRYRVLLVDYPSIGGSETVPPTQLTLDRACTDLLEAADAAGFERFAYWGGTFGAVVGLALAARTTRVSALVCAGWPPLGLDYADLVRGARGQLADPPVHARVMLRSPAQYAQWLTFYASVPADWDATVTARVRCPRLLVYGADAETSVGDVAIPIAELVRRHAATLADRGWQVHEVPGRGSTLILEPQALVPPARRFLDSVSMHSDNSQGEEA